MDNNIEKFIRYEVVRVLGDYNMITEANDAAFMAGLTVEEYLDVIKNYDQLKAHCEAYRAISKENEDTYTKRFTEMTERYRAAQEKQKQIKEEVNEIMKRSLAEPAPF